MSEIFYFILSSAGLKVLFTDQHQNLILKIRLRFLSSWLLNGILDACPQASSPPLSRAGSWASVACVLSPIIPFLKNKPQMTYCFKEGQWCIIFQVYCQTPLTCLPSITIFCVDITTSWGLIPRNLICIQFPSVQPIPARDTSSL